MFKNVIYIQLFDQGKVYIALREINKFAKSFNIENDNNENILSLIRPLVAKLPHSRLSNDTCAVGALPLL